MADLHERVFGDDDLLRCALRHVPRSLRAGRTIGVCKRWQSIILLDSDLYRKIVVLNGFNLQSRDPYWCSQPGSRVSKLVYDARHFIIEGALPLMPHEVATKIPNREWVEHLFLESVPGVMRGEHLPPVLEQRFPNLTTLLLSGVHDFCKQPLSGVPPQRSFAQRVEQVQAWVRWHMQASLRHLHMDDKNTTNYHVYFDARDQPGLTSMQLSAPGPIDGPQLIPVMQGWSTTARAALVNLALMDFPPQTVVLEAIRQLPNLKRLRWQRSGPTAEELRQIAEAATSSKLEALYFNFDSFDMPNDAFDCFAAVGTLRELVVACDSCVLDDPVDPDDFGINYAGTLRSLSAHMRALLPRAAVLVCDASREYLHLDPLHRQLLPGIEEDWHNMGDALPSSRDAAAGSGAETIASANIRRTYQLRREKNAKLVKSRRGTERTMGRMAEFRYRQWDPFFGYTPAVGWFFEQYGYEPTATSTGASSQGSSSQGSSSQRATEKPDWAPGDSSPTY